MGHAGLWDAQEQARTVKGKLQSIIDEYICVL